MKKLESRKVENVTGGDAYCDATLDGLWTFAAGAIAIGGPGGWALGLTIGGTTALLYAAGACK